MRTPSDQTALEAAVGFYRGELVPGGYSTRLAAGHPQQLPASNKPPCFLLSPMQADATNETRAGQSRSPSGSCRQIRWTSGRTAS